MDRATARIGALVPVRIDSRRLPRKALIEVQGKPLLQYVVERVRAAEGLDEVVLATTDREVDDPLEAVAARLGVGIHRGDLQDVAGRLLEGARAFALDAFARVNGDSPLLDFSLLSRAVSEFRGSDYDIVTNVLRRTYPPGMSVEVLATEVFAAGHEEMSEAGHFEHVTRFFYERPERFEILNIESGHEGWSAVHAAVDDEEDLERFRRVMARIDGRHLDYTGASLIRLLQQIEVA